jgi:TRAP-type mannitol/chloroaromatic compound transport system permease small subunit
LRYLLGFSAAIDWLNEKVGYVCNFLVLAAVIVSAGNAMVRYAFDYSSNGWLELQWYMFAVMVMFGASYTFKRFFHQAYEVGELSSNAGGLVRWPIKFVLPGGLFMLALQGASEVIKRIAALQGQVTIDAKYERPTQ